MKDAEYVDKSLLLKVPFDSLKEEGALFGALAKGRFYPPTLITAPRCFGKSVNLDMVQRFVEIQIDRKTGKPIPKTSKDSNYKLFEGLEIMKHKDFVDSCFGTHPVIKLNFFCNTVETLSEESAYTFCKGVIHVTYKQHEYLTKFTGEEELNDEARATCMGWYRDDSYEQRTAKQIQVSVTMLAKYLYKYHGKKALILVDEYDSLLYETRMECLKYEFL